MDKEYKLSDLIEKFKEDFKDVYKYEDVECIGFMWSSRLQQDVAADSLN